MNRELGGWRIWLTDDRQYNSREHEWAEVPDDGVLVLKLYYDAWANPDVRYTLVLDGDDHYFHVPETNLYGCSNDPIEEIKERYPGALVKRGMWTTAEEFYFAKQRAQHTTAP
jgi:hypothetical protein